MIEGSTSTFNARVVRPAYFFPESPDERQNLRSTGARVLDVILSPILCTVSPSSVTPLDWLGTFMVGVAKGNWPEEKLFRNSRLRELMNSSSSS